MDAQIQSMRTVLRAKRKNDDRKQSCLYEIAYIRLLKASIYSKIPNEKEYTKVFTFIGEGKKGKEE